MNARGGGSVGTARPELSWCEERSCGGGEREISKGWEAEVLKRRGAWD